MKPLAIDLCCGLGGWSEGLLAEGWDVVGFDIERHKYGEHQYPAQLVLQDILTLSGEQFRGKASLIVASPPCQKYSYMAMPWTRAKALQAWYRDPQHPERIAELNALFDACVRIGKEAQCPTIIENVRGAQPWVGRARWMYGSFALWGDVPALMPITFKAVKVPTMGAGWYPPGHPKHVKGLGFNTHAERNLREDIKNTGGSRFNIAHNTTSGKGRNPDGRNIDGTKVPGRGAKGWFGDYAEQKATGTISPGRMHGKNHPKRKMASAMIAKIPEPLSRFIAQTFKPRIAEAAE